MTKLYGTLAIDVKDITAQRFVLRVPYVDKRDDHQLQPRDIHGTYDAPLVAGQMVRVFNSAVTYRHLCDLVVRHEAHRELMMAFARAALPVQLKKGSEVELGRLVPATQVQGHEMCCMGFESFMGRSVLQPICDGNILSVFENVTLGQVIHQGLIEILPVPYRDAQYQSLDTGAFVEGRYAVTFKNPPQPIMKIYATRGLPAEITCP